MADDKKTMAEITATNQTTPKKAVPKKVSAKAGVKKKVEKKAPIKKVTVKKSTVKTATSKTTARRPATKQKAVNTIVKGTSAEEKAESNVKDEINNLKSQASNSVKDTANKGKAKASEAMSGISGKIRETAETIDASLGEKYGGFARNAADSIDEFADTIDNKDVDDIIEDTRNFVRKSPALAIGAAAAIGFLLTRLIRAGKD